MSKNINKEIVVTATYTATSRFKIPEGIDVETLLEQNKAWVKWDKLFIQTEDDCLEIHPHIDAEDSIDWKHGADVGIDTYNSFFDDQGQEEENEDEEDEEEEKEEDEKEKETSHETVE